MPWRSGDRELLPFGESSPDGGDKLRSTRGAVEKRPSTFSGNLGFSRKPEEDHVSGKLASWTKSHYFGIPTTIFATLGTQISMEQTGQLLSSCLTFTRRASCQKQQMWLARWLIPVITPLRRLGQKDQEFKAILGYLMSSLPAWNTRDHLNNKKKENLKFQVPS